MSESSRMHESLRALPEPGLPPAIWQRLQSRRRQQIRRRKMGAGLAALAMVAVMAVPLLSPITTAPERDPHLSLFEQPHASGAGDVHEQLEAVDRALQTAYDRGASDAEIAPMWVARNALLGQLRPRQAAHDNRT